ncbi:MAG: septum formation initiator family protein [Holosporales bacterium]|jgi:cell division protein FtsB|nr:septum formation initiator family protein [Holosporales bacterium]
MNFQSRFVGSSNNFKLVCKISFVVVLFGYFLFHAISGNNGLLSYVKIKKRLTEQTEKLELLRRDLGALTLRVRLLSNESLDLDMLDERCRMVLNYCFPDDAIVKEQTVSRG